MAENRTGCGAGPRRMDRSRSKRRRSCHRLHAKM